MALKSQWVRCEAVVIIVERFKKLPKTFLNEYLEYHPHNNGAIHRLEDCWYRNQQIHLETILLIEHTYLCDMTNKIIMMMMTPTSANVREYPAKRAAAVREIAPGSAVSCNRAFIIIVIVLMIILMFN